MVTIEVVTHKEMEKEVVTKEAVTNKLVEMEVVTNEEMALRKCRRRKEVVMLD